MSADTYFLERPFPGESFLRQVSRIIAQGRTQYHSYTIFESPHFGKVLAIGSDVQSTQADEYVYHETLVHPAMLFHSEPRRVLLIGNAEGAALREVLKHPNVEQVVQVDYDGELLDLAREHLEEWHQGAYQDQRVSVQVSDPRKYLEEAQVQFDVIISDLAGPSGGESGKLDFDVSFCRLLRTRLTAGGVFGSRAGTIVHSGERLRPLIHSTASQVFKFVRSYRAYIPGNFRQLGFILATDAHDPAGLSAGTLRVRILDRQLALAHLTPEYVRSLFALPRDFEQALERELSPPSQEGSLQQTRARGQSDTAQRKQ